MIFVLAIFYASEGKVWIVCTNEHLAMYANDHYAAGKGILSGVYPETEGKKVVFITRDDYCELEEDDVDGSTTILDESDASFGKQPWAQNKKTKTFYYQAHLLKKCKRVIGLTGT